MQGFQPTPDLHVAGRFRLTERLGKSPNADTWRAVDTTDGDAPVIVKLLGGVDLTNVDQLRAFEREARVLMSLDHPGVPRVRAATQDAQGVFVLALDAVEGLDLQTHLTKGPRLGTEDLLKVARGLLDVLAYLHDRVPPVFHRDIKPSNIVRRPDGAVVLVDFGAVCDGWRADHTIAVGTLGYMAPEQLHGHVGPRSDLYSVGATLLHVATGRSPRECLDPETSALVIPDGISLATPLRALIEACIRPAASARPESAVLARALLDAPPAPAPAAARPWPVAPNPPLNALPVITDDSVVANAFNLPPAPRDPLSSELAPALRAFDAATRKQRQMRGFIFFMSLVATGIVMTGMTQSDVPTKDPATLVAIATLILFGPTILTFVLQSRSAARRRQPDSPVFMAFRDHPTVYATIINIGAAGGESTDFRVQFRWSHAPQSEPFAEKFSKSIAGDWVIGQRVPFIEAPNNNFVPMIVNQHIL